MPNRLIRDSIHTSDKVNAMSDFQFRLWVNLITYVDDYGRGDARPAVIKGTCFPLRDRLTNKDIEAALNALAGIGCVGLYEVDGKPYLYFPNWGSHQNIRNKKSRFPAPDGSCKQLQANDFKCSRNPIQSESEIESEIESETRTREENPFGDGGGEERPNFNTVEAYVGNNIPGMNYANMQEMESFKDDLPEDVIRYAVDRACERNIRNWGYVKGILNKIISAGLHTLAEVKEHDARFAQGGKAAKAAQNNPALNYEQRDYTAQDDDELYTDMDYYAETGIVKSIAEVRRMRERGEIK